MTSYHKSSFLFFNDTATTEIYTLSLHDALPIWHPARAGGRRRERLGRRPLRRPRRPRPRGHPPVTTRDRKSTRLNSSHANISYAVFCLKKYNKTMISAHQFRFYVYQRQYISQNE